MSKIHIRSDLKDLLEFTLTVMKTMDLPIRQGHVFDLKNLEFKVHSSLIGASARFHVAQETDIIHSEDPINAHFSKCEILYSSQIEKVLNESEHKYHKYVKSIIVHELVHYLQPHHKDDGQTAQSIRPRADLYLT